jgi:acyl-coenzyme A thioesterase PaaI-like protein
MWHEDGTTRGRVAIRPEMWATGSRRPRLGLLFTLADVVGGTPSSGALVPTVDLRVQLLTPAPSEGDILLEARPLKVGRRLWTGEVLFRTPDGRPVFGRCEYSFMNQRIVDVAGVEPPRERLRQSVPPLPAASFDELFGMRLLDDGTVEMDAHEAVRNGVAGTIQGGAQATMAEVAAEHVLGAGGLGRYVVCDLHLRYLSALKTGPAVARTDVLPGDPMRPVVQVSIVDKADGRLVSTAVAVCRPDEG